MYIALHYMSEQFITTRQHSSRVRTPAMLVFVPIIQHFVTFVIRGHL